MAAYFVFNYRVNDQDAYQPYLAEVPKVLEAHGAEILAADFESEGIEGTQGTSRSCSNLHQKRRRENGTTPLNTRRSLRFELTTVMVLQQLQTRPAAN